VKNRIQGFLVNPRDGRITHLVLREGHLWGKKDISIKLDHVAEFGDNLVTLNLAKAEIEKMPAAETAL
jgi:hypothetical protein